MAVFRYVLNYDNADIFFKDSEQKHFGHPPLRPVHRVSDHILWRQRDAPRGGGDHVVGDEHRVCAGGGAAGQPRGQAGRGQPHDDLRQHGRL